MKNIQWSPPYMGVSHLLFSIGRIEIRCTIEDHGEYGPTTYATVNMSKTFRPDFKRTFRGDNRNAEARQWCESLFLPLIEAGRLYSNND